MSSRSQAHGLRRRSRTVAAEPLPIAEYRLNRRHLAPGERTEGIVTFERPGFKQRGERLQLQVARADAADRPLLVPIPFTPDENP
jgi:hypothetical protein